MLKSTVRLQIGNRFRSRGTCAKRRRPTPWPRDPHSRQRLRCAPRRRVEGDHRAAAGGRAAVLRHDRQARRAVRGGGAPARAAPPRPGGHADRRRDGPPPGGVPPPGHDRHPCRRGPHPRRRRVVGHGRGRLRRHHGGVVRHPRRGRLRGRHRAARAPDQAHPHPSRRADDRDLRLPETQQAALQLGYPMTTEPTAAYEPSSDLRTPSGALYSEAARDHLWMHFTRHSVFEDRTEGGLGHSVPIITRGEGYKIWDDRGNEYIDGLAGLFVVQVGHGREELAEAAAKQARELAFFPLWSYAHPRAIELAERLAAGAPGDLNRVFFTTGGGEAVETAWKLAKQYFKLMGKPTKHKVISRAVAYHGTPQGALSITGIPAAKEMFEPLVPGAFKVPNTNMYRAPEHLRDDNKAFGRWAADRIAEAIEFEGPDTVAAVFLEPVQNSGGCFPPPEGYFERVREICDEYDVLLVSDETICAFGRIGDMFACNDFGYVPDIITCAKGMTSGYSPIGAMIASDRLFEPFRQGTNYFPHGYTFGGHPVSAAVAMENLDIFEREGLNAHVHENAPKFRASLEKLLDLPLVGDVRGEGYFYGIELVKDKATRETFDDDESERLLRGFLSKALFDAGLYCRADDRGDPVIQLAPPLTIGPSEFDEIEQILRGVLTEAWTRL